MNDVMLNIAMVLAGILLIGACIWAYRVENRGKGPGDEDRSK